MSTLVAVRKGSRASIASDTLFIDGSTRVSSKYKLNHQKIYGVNGAFVGFFGWAVMNNIFESVLERYPSDMNFNSRKHIFETFLNLHSKLKSEYFISKYEKEDQPVESSQWSCLIVSSGGVFGVHSFREVVEYDRFWAGGSGMQLALGAMHAIYDTVEDCEAIATAGINAACEFDSSSMLPMRIYNITLRAEKGTRF